MAFSLVPDRGGEVMPRLAAACPSFKRPPNAEGPFIEVGAFARHLVDLLVRDDTAELASVFAEVEVLYRIDAPGIDDILTVGLIESLQSITADAGGDVVGRLRRFLGPSASGAWDRVDAFWAAAGVLQASVGTKTLSDSVRELSTTRVVDSQALPSLPEARQIASARVEP